MNREFYELCYDRYKAEMQEADVHYRKSGVVLGVIPILGAASVGLGRLDVSRLAFIRVDVFLFFLFALLAIISLIISVLHLYKCICPKSYSILEDMDIWQNWLEKYKNQLQETGNCTDSNELDKELDSSLIKNITLRLVESQPINARINESRRKAFKQSIRFAAFSLVFIAFQALMALILKLQGI